MFFRSQLSMLIFKHRYYQVLTFLSSLFVLLWLMFYWLLRVACFSFLCQNPSSSHFIVCIHGSSLKEDLCCLMTLWLSHVWLHEIRLRHPYNIQRMECLSREVMGTELACHRDAIDTVTLWGGLVGWAWWQGNMDRGRASPVLQHYQSYHRET